MVEQPASAEDLTAAHRALVDRIASGRTLQRSARLRELLLDIAGHTLAGEPHKLTEQAIGIRLFGRPESYNPADDNIVRSSVRQLRLKLKEYFESEGASETGTLEIPKGSYVAVFAPRPVAEIRPVPAPPAVRDSRPGWGVVAGLAAVCAVLAIACAVLWSQRQAAPPEEPDTVFGRLFAQHTGPIRFVFTDSVLVVAGKLIPPPPLEQYIDQSYLDDVKRLLPGERAALLLDHLRGRQITSFADVEILAKVLQVHPSAGHRIELRHARFVRTRDFKTENFVIMGSFTANPWNRLFDSSLQFAIEPNDGIRNLHPKSGEPAYWPWVADRGVAPARIALLDNLTSTGFVLTISGVTMEATEGAGEFLLRPDSMAAVAQALGLRPGERLPRFEIVLNTSSLQGTARSAHIVAARRW
ncbi:MAG TPA: hypothetical protein VG456_27570 [Candidatus Sulfopaludibacter sp.]|jgi:hypothetical protein|nr:hypothetical protein [Candidatus Sulfopaludibacter sp.]